MTIINMVGGGNSGGGGGHDIYTTSSTLTVTWTETSNPAAFNPIYSDDATGLTAGSPEFDAFFGYSAVLLDNKGEEKAEVLQGLPGKLDVTKLGTLTGTENNVMIKFPCRGIKMSKSGSDVTLSITTEKNKTGYQYYAFTKGTTEKDYLYLGAYKSTFSNDNSTVASSFTSGTTYMKSWATGVKTLNFSPCANQTIANMRATVSKYGNGYSMITVYPRWYINCLYMMKYGNPNSQSVIGAGYSGGSASVAPGGTNSQTNATYGTSSNKQQVKLFGLEDWWGNLTEFMDGCYFNGSKSLTVDKTNSIFQSSAYSTNLGVASSGYMKTIDGSNDGMFRNTSASAGSSTTYYADASYSSAARVLRVGGSWDYGTDNGAFCVYGSSASYASADSGGRLMFL